jgi:hypothetical protein
MATHTKLMLSGVLIALAWLGTAQAITIAVSPHTQQVGIGSQFQVDLTIAGVNNVTTPPLRAFDINLSFDPNLVLFQFAEFGDQLNISGGGSQRAVDDFTTAGTVQISETSLDSAGELARDQASNFVLATLTFNALSVEGTSPLGITLNALTDANGGPLTADLVSGCVGVGSACAPAVPLPPTAWLLLTGLIGMFARTANAVQRRRART